MMNLRDLKNVFRQVEDLKRRSRALRDNDDLSKARDTLGRAIDILEPVLKQFKPLAGDEPAPEDVRELAAQLADCYGSLGGILRRQGFLQDALASYASGKTLEQNDVYRISNSYNQVQWLILRILLVPRMIKGEQSDMERELVTAVQTLRRQIRSVRRQDPWAHSDLGLLCALLEDQVAADSAWNDMDALSPIASVYSSGLPVLKELAAVLPSNLVLPNAVARFQAKISSA